MGNVWIEERGPGKMCGWGNVWQWKHVAGYRENVWVGKRVAVGTCGRVTLGSGNVGQSKRLAEGTCGRRNMWHGERGTEGTWGRRNV